jgi:NADPH2:quinone reductase
VRGALIRELESPPEPAALDEPPAGVGESVVTVDVVALNPIDIAVGSGVFYGGHPPLPYPPGCEAAGRNEAGELVYLFGDGRGIAKAGFLAERVAVPADLPLRLPAGADPAIAAAIGIAGIAGWVATAWKAKPTADDRVLVLGASGAVGRIAVQAAKLHGAHVIAAGRDTTKLEDVGADEIATLDEIPDGFTVCIDPLWGEPLANALAHADRHARIVHVGQSAGPEAPLRSADVRGKELTIQGHSNFALSRDDRARAYLELLDHVSAGRIVVEIERHPLDDVATAWEHQRSGPGKKIVVDL